MRVLSVLSLLLVVIIFAFGRSQSFTTSCTAQAVICYADDMCVTCADLLQGLVESGSIDTDITNCPAFFAGVCSAVDTDACDVTNVYLLDFARCIVEEMYGCSGFTTCGDALGNATVPTAAPTATPTASPTVASIIAPTIPPTPAEDDDDDSTAGTPNDNQPENEDDDSGASLTIPPTPAEDDDDDSTAGAPNDNQPENEDDDSGASAHVTASGTAVLLGTLVALCVV